MPTLSFHQLTKHYGPVTVLDGFTATALPGRVTAFLGVNGAGKTTSMRIMLGLSDADQRDGDDRRRPLRRPAAPDARHRCGARPGLPPQPVRPQPHPPHRDAGRRADQHGRRRSSSASVSGPPRVGGSAGSRSGCASGSPSPRPSWGTRRSSSSTSRSTASTRTASGRCAASCASFADAGGTVFLSSHLLTEVAAVADDLVVIHRGTLAAAGAVDDLVTDDTDLESVFHNLIHPTDTQEVWS